MIIFMIQTVELLSKEGFKITPTNAIPKVTENDIPYVTMTDYEISQIPL